MKLLTVPARSESASRTYERGGCEIRSAFLGRFTTPVGRELVAVDVDPFTLQGLGRLAPRLPAAFRGLGVISKSRW